MKKISTLTFAVFILSGRFSQYTYSLIQTPEIPVVLTTITNILWKWTRPFWTVILGPNQSTPSWSSTETIPFNFNFNGLPVTQYKVSSTGVLTFETSTILFLRRKCHQMQLFQIIRLWYGVLKELV